MGETVTEATCGPGAAHDTAKVLAGGWERMKTGQVSRPPHRAQTPDSGSSQGAVPEAWPPSGDPAMGPLCIGAALPGFSKSRCGHLSTELRQHWREAEAMFSFNIKAQGRSLVLSFLTSNTPQKQQLWKQEAECTQRL